MTIEDFFAKVLPKDGEKDQRFNTTKIMVETYVSLFNRALEDVRTLLLSADVGNAADLYEFFNTRPKASLEAFAQGHVAQRVMHHLFVVLSGSDEEEYSHLVSQSCDPDEVASMLRERLIDEALWSGNSDKVDAYRLFIYNLRDRED